MSAITTHILDTAKGKPAGGVTVRLEYGKTASAFTEIGRGVTDSDGRIKTLLAAGKAIDAGHYRLWFEVGPYFASLGLQAFYDQVPVQFQIVTPDKHYHVPLLINPFGYSTYRGS